MIRRTLLVRWGLLAGVLALVALIILAGRRLGLNELAIVGAIVCFVLLADGLRYIIAQVIHGYRRAKR